MNPAGRVKDQQLAHFAAENNIAQFVSFGPGEDPVARYNRIRGVDGAFARPEDAVAALLTVAPSCNIRTFQNPPVKSAPFHYGLTNVAEITDLVRKYAADGYYTIVNETIDVNDGGVSGVALGGVVEFAPQGTPRAVEEPGIFTASYEVAISILRIVYGFEPEVPKYSDRRVEFSIHPQRVGYRRSHTLLWEMEAVKEVELIARPDWPNRFSRFLGDKVFGLLIAHILGFPVPRTIVISRRVAPFIFGQETSSGERWMRTCPPEQVPGKFTTTPRWSDPFQILAEEDPTGESITSVLSQDAINAEYSGATSAIVDGSDRVEGVIGQGVLFMQGLQGTDQLPNKVIDDVHTVLAGLRQHLGPCRIEWVHDGNVAWVVQLHLARGRLDPGVLSPGHAHRWLDYDPSEGLGRLRQLVDQAFRSRAGVLVTKKVGITSHVGDILRRAGIPGKFRNHE